MNIKFLLCIAAILTAQSVVFDVDARSVGGGGGGGGRGGVGGGGGGGRSMGGEGRAASMGNRSVQRSPSLSRSSFPSEARMSRPVQPNFQNNARPEFNRPQATMPQNRPQMRSTQNFDHAGQRNSGNNITRNQLQNFIKSNPSPQAFNRPNTINANHNPRDLNKTVNDLNQFRANSNRYNGIGNDVRRNLNDRYPNRNNWFNNNFWDHHNYRPAYYNGYNDWWAPTTVGALSGWLGWQSQPYYYGGGYDSGGGYGDSNGYGDVGGSEDYWGPTNPIIINPATIGNPQTQIIDSGTPQGPTGDWLPLGVFSVSKNGDSIAPPNMFIQLALSKQGEISGTYYNSTTDQVHELEGLVDEASQRAAWKISDQEDSPIIETGLYNLADAEVPIRVYFPQGNTQDMLLIRLSDQPPPQ